jgi:hypothetical protein
MAAMAVAVAGYELSAPPGKKKSPALSGAFLPPGYFHLGVGEIPGQPLSNLR